jgi:hypothetical protein
MPDIRLPHTRLNKALQKGARTQRLSPQEAHSRIEFLSPVGTRRLGQAALANRRQRYGQIATGERLNAFETTRGIGFKTTATMMFGHVETDGDIVDHFFRIRDLQERTGAFSGFVAWGYKPSTPPLAGRIPNPSRWVYACPKKLTRHRH